jgi:hypothetical protein
MTPVPLSLPSFPETSKAEAAGTVRYVNHPGMVTLSFQASEAWVTRELKFWVKVPPVYEIWAAAGLEQARMASKNGKYFVVRKLAGMNRQI